MKKTSKRLKAAFALLVALTLAVGCFTSVFAVNDKAPTYTAKSGHYKAEKISHPLAGIGEVDGLVEYDSGDNDRGQNYCWSAAAYGDWMYVGTCYAAISTTIKIIAREMGMDQPTFKAAVDALYNGALYMGDEKNNPEDVNRAVIVKLNMKTGETKIVIEPRKIGGYRAAIAFNGKLYFVAAGNPPELIEIDPANNDATQVVYKSQNPSDLSISVGIRGLTVHNNKLVAAMIGDSGAYIVASDNPSAGQDAFEIIGTQEDLLDYPAYHYMDSIFGGSIWDMISFNNKLYFTVVTGKNGNKQAFALFSGEENAETGKWDYKVLVGDEKDGAKYPYGFGAERSGACNMIVHDGYLYLGGYNDPMIALPQALQLHFEPLYKDLAEPVRLWRMDKNESFELVIGEPDEYFDKAVGNMGAGFGSNMNQYVWRMESYQGRLYVGTFDICGLAYPLMQFTNGDILKMSPTQWKTQLQYIEDFLNRYNSDGSNQLLGALGNLVGVGGTFAEAIEGALQMSGLGELLGNATGSISGILGGLGGGNINNAGGDVVFLNAFAALVGLYTSVRESLPEQLTSVLDPVLTVENAQQLAYFNYCCQYLSKGEKGFDLLVSENGTDFEVVTRNGLGDPNNHGLRVFAVTDQGLSIGTANPFYGAQVWLLSDKIEVPEAPDEPTEPTEPAEPTEPTEPAEPSTDGESESLNGGEDIPDTTAESAPMLIAAIPAALTMGGGYGAFRLKKARRKDEE